MAAAYLLVGTSAPTTYRAEGRIHAVNTVVSYDGQGDAIPTTVIPRFGNEVNPKDFLVPRVAELATRELRVSGLDPQELLSRIIVLPLSATDVDLFFSARSSQRAEATLEAYTSAYVDWRRAQQARALTDAVKTLEKTLDTFPRGTEPAIVTRRLELRSHIDRLKLAADLVPEQIALVGGVTASVQGEGVPRWLGATGGLIAGLVLGTLLALLLVRFDRRVRRASDVSFASVRVIDSGSRSKLDSFLRLRSELELSGLGVYLDVLAVTSPSRREDLAGIARELAETFASVGTRTVLVSADVESGEETTAQSRGVVSFLNGSDEELHSVALAENLTWIPRGSGDVHSEALLTSARLDRLLTEAHSLGEVVIVDAPPVSEPSGLLIAARAHVTLLVLQRSRSRWSELEGGFARLQHVVKGPVEICFDRTRRKARALKSRGKPVLEPSSLSSATASRS